MHIRILLSRWFTRRIVAPCVFYLARKRATLLRRATPGPDCTFIYVHGLFYVKLLAVIPTICIFFWAGGKGITRSDYV